MGQGGRVSRAYSSLGSVARRGTGLLMMFRDEDDPAAVVSVRAAKAVMSRMSAIRERVEVSPLQPINKVGPVSANCAGGYYRGADVRRKGSRISVGAHGCASV